MCPDATVEIDRQQQGLEGTVFFEKEGITCWLKILHFVNLVTKSTAGQVF